MTPRRVHSAPEVIRRRRAGRVAGAAACLCLLAASPPPVEPPHNLHVANVRMVVEGPNVVARIRVFRDDLEKSLKRPVRDDSATKLAVGAYVTRATLVTADGAALTAEVLDSGAEQDGDQPVWWLLVQWKAPRPVKVLGLRVHVLFDTFSDQQNIVTVAHSPSDERRGLYFQAGDRKEQIVTF